MTGENVILLVFIGLSVLSAGLLYLFFRRYRQHEQPGHQKLRLLAGNLLVLLLVGSVAILSGEIYYRYFDDSTDSFGLTKVSQRWMKRHIIKNRSGIRDSVEEYDLQRTPGKRRVTFLGDSFTEGHGIVNVENRFANLIRVRKPKVDIHVLAFSGVDTGLELDGLQGFVNQGYELDLLVLVYCLNDIADIVPEWQKISDRIYADQIDQSLPGNFFVEHSYLLNTLFYRIKAIRDPDISHYYGFVRDAYDGPIWKEQAERLTAIRNEVESHGGELLVVTFPFLHALGPSYEYQKVHRQLDQHWKKLEVPHLDLLSAFEPYDPAELVVSAFDAHPNEKAHAIAADAITTFLEKYLAESAERPAREKQRVKKMDLTLHQTKISSDFR